MLGKSNRRRSSQTIEQITVLQNQMSTIMGMLQGMAGSSRAQQTTRRGCSAAPEAPPAVEVPPSETTHVNEMTPSSHHLIPINWESIVMKKLRKQSHEGRAEEGQFR
ncbi:hypothetical protein Adt_02244 [Abeliophyllum distichum]|uniref:Uncharacterized protein n=1 Tax=Abeliophyllum distichum TaxID=126358 RepID=A0ABD1RXY5_9LAMI